MENNCHCFSCSEYENSGKVDFLKKRKPNLGLENVMKTSSDICLHSNSAFDRLPDEVLIRILSFISPVNIDDLLTLIASEMVSKRFLRCVKDNQNIWENATELVIGFHPDLPNDQYLCHIGHFTLELFLRRVPKITKVIVNVDSWLCLGMINKQLLPIIDRFAEKLEIQQLIVHDFSSNNRSLNEKLINNSTQSLGNFQFSAVRNQPNSNLMKMSNALANCAVLNIRTVINASNVKDLYYFLRRLMKFLQLLEISGYNLKNIIKMQNLLSEIPIFSTPFRIQTLRFTNPYGRYRHDGNLRLHHLNELLYIPNTSCISELEFHYCAYQDDLSLLPHILDDANYLSHFMLTFSPLKFNKTPQIVEFLKNIIHTKDDMKISITFQHFDDDVEEKLEIGRSLLIAFDVAHSVEHELIWEFIRGTITVILKLGKVEKESLTCRHY